MYILEQQRQLEELFAKMHYPTWEQREEMAQNISVSKENVKVCFKNQRSKMRREQREHSLVGTRL